MREENAYRSVSSDFLEEKKAAILRVVSRMKFSRVPFDKVSINQIIKMQKLPRAFYTYFEDK